MSTWYAFRDWLASRLIDLACLVEPPRPKLEAIMRELAPSLKAGAQQASATPTQEQPWSFYGLKEVRERVFERTDQAGRVLYIHSANLDVAKELRKVASDCELGAIVGFRVTWLGPNNPVQTLVYPAQHQGTA